MTRNSRTAIRLLGILLAFVLTLASRLAVPSAQASAVPGVLPDALPDSLMILLPSRDAGAVDDDLANAEARANASNEDEVAAQGRLGQDKARVDVCTQEIETVKAKVKLAKEQKDKTAQADYEQRVKTKELQLNVLKARKDMREAEVALAGKRRATVQAEAGFLRKELELIGKREELARQRAAAPGTMNLDALVRLQADIRDLEHRCLEVLKDVAEKQKGVAEGEANLIDKRLKLEEAQAAYFVGPKK